MGDKKEEPTDHTEKVLGETEADVNADNPTRQKESQGDSPERIKPAWRCKCHGYTYLSRDECVHTHEVEELSPSAEQQGISDSVRLDYLQELIRNCPHAEFTFNDDPDCEEGANGFCIRVEGCELYESFGASLRDCIDADIQKHSLVELSVITPK